MPVEENLMQAILLTFGTAMVPVLELRGAIPVEWRRDSPRPRPAWCPSWAIWCRCLLSCC